MLDRFLAMKPGDVNYPLALVLMLVGLALGIWLQYRISHSADAWLERREKRSQIDARDTDA